MLQPHRLTQPQPAVLVLSDGIVLYGKSFGHIGTTTGELCFNTGMTGYQEVFTDPSYAGQVLIMNSAHIGNYGTKRDEVESDTVQIRGLIARNLEAKFSRAQADDSLQNYLQINRIVAIDGIDTRALVTHIRHKGTMNCIISSDSNDIPALQKLLQNCPDMNGLELASTVSTPAPYEVGDSASKVKIAVLDFGIKKNICNDLVQRGVRLKIFPAKTDFATLQKFQPGGYFFSNGPGDPASMSYAVATIKEILKLQKPTFGICLGHQLLALANGVPTHKMHHGHRGLNHPVKNITTGVCEITTQNHGFVVDTDAIIHNPNLEVTHINLNDGSNEGLRMKNQPAFSVQYHPEATPGPHDSKYLFDTFIEMLG